MKDQFAKLSVIRARIFHGILYMLLHAAPVCYLLLQHQLVKDVEAFTLEFRQFGIETWVSRWRITHTYSNYIVSNYG